MQSISRNTSKRDVVYNKFQQLQISLWERPYMYSTLDAPRFSGKTQKYIRVSCHLSTSKCAHYDDVIMTTMASQITSLAVVYSIVYSGVDQRKHQSSASLALVRGIHRDRWIPPQRASNAENVTMWWRHHAGCWNPPSWTTGGCLSYTINGMAADVLAPFVARASAVMILTCWCQNIPVSAPKCLNYNAKPGISCDQSGSIH